LTASLELELTNCRSNNNRINWKKQTTH